MSVLENKNYKCSVSSVLNKEVKQYGKSFMFDGRTDTSWASDHGTPQWIAFAFEAPVNISALLIQFQGGFAGKESIIHLFDASSELVKVENFYPEDVNSKQTFTLDQSLENILKIKIIFESSTDFFGRIIIYDLDII